MDASMLRLLLKGAFVTVEISLIAIILGLLLGIVFGILNSNRLKIWGLTHVIKTYVSLARGTPIFVQLLIVYFALPKALDVDISPFMAGVITLSFNSTAYLSEAIRAGINAIAPDQWEAAHFLGYSRLQSLRFIILPQALQNVLPSITNELIALIKESSILMVIGVPELTKTSKEIVARELNPMEIYLAAAALYFAITFSLSQLTKILERRQH